MRTRWLLWFLFGFVPSGLATADEIVLRNGDRLTGAIVQLENQQLRFASELVGELSLPWSAVETASSDQIFAVTLPDPPVLLGTVRLLRGEIEIGTAAEQISVPRESLRALRRPDDQQAHEIEQERLRSPGFFDFWQATADSGLSLTRGNSDTLTVNLGVTAQRETERDKLSTYVRSLFARDRTAGRAEITANALRTGVRYEHKLSERFSTFGFTDFDFDEVQELDLRWVFGGGLGWNVRRSERTLFQLFAGGSLNQEFFRDQPVRRAGEALAGEELTYRLSARTSLQERLTVFSNLSNLGEYRVTLDSTIETALNQWLSWQVTLSDRYLSNPPPGVERNDLLLTTGIRLKFGQPPPQSFEPVATPALQ